MERLLSGQRRRPPPVDRENITIKLSTAVIIHAAECSLASVRNQELSWQFYYFRAGEEEPASWPPWWRTRPWRSRGRRPASWPAAGTCSEPSPRSGPGKTGTLIFMTSAKQRKELKCSGICCSLVPFKILKAVYYHNLNINAHILVAA